MKILIIGNRKHQLLRVNVLEIKRQLQQQEGGVVIDALTQETDNDEKCDDIFDNIYSLYIPRFIEKSRMLRGGIKQILFRKRLKILCNDYDIIHIHYVEDILTRDVNYFIDKIKKKGKKIIVSVWGSDFFRATENKRRKILKLLNNVDFVTTSNIKAGELIKSYYGDKLIHGDIYFYDFISAPLFLLKDITNKFTKEQSCCLLGLDTDKKIITVGYNANKMQQHIRILDILEKDEKLKSYRDKIQFVLPITYPRDKKYIKALKKRVEYSFYKIKLFIEFLEDIEVAHLRNATSIMLQLQTTDMLSASMIEHLYAQNKVITGSWLPYQELQQKGIVFSSIDGFNKLPSVLLEMLESNVNLSINKKLIEEGFEEESVISQWVKMYRDEKKGC